jgi:hypothetical protein
MQGKFRSGSSSSDRTRRNGAFLQAHPRGILDFLRRKSPTKIKTFESESSFVEYAKDMTAFVPPSFSPQ